jgi:hypothetical protein
MMTRALVAASLAACVGATSSVALAQNAPGTEGPSVNVQVPTPPPADQPLIRKVPKPYALSVDGGAGVLGYIGGTGALGPAWNVRVGADFTPRFALEAQYLGAANRRSDNTGTLTYQSVDAEVRYNVLRADEAPVQPFLTAGLGWAGWIGPGGAPAALVIPISAGVERMLTERIKIGARLNVRPSFFEDLGHGYERKPPRGDTWALIANVGGGF